jgi:branched-chain amino acid transport system permease protein
VGATLVLSIQNYLASTTIPVTIFIGGAFVACVMLFRRGIVGEIIHLLAPRGRSGE